MYFRNDENDVETKQIFDLLVKKKKKFSTKKKKKKKKD